ncbi:MAG TPA: DinB family protein [Intrasporangium sp.]|uniref:DinB family protein n=1 Tax=Intrasporangium sp. TaxID=1925024 RepID=UPI002D78BE7B|nr:DinB family protein [Intrasporangium sp.]HET7399782.1 DinB family protein [Intrasporangium sp.]
MPALVSPVVDERDGLIAFLDQQRDAFASAAYGLTEEQLRLAPTAGALTMGGLLKHVAHTEWAWVGRITAAPGHSPADGGSREQRAAAYGGDFLLTDEDTLASLLQALDEVGAATREVLRTADLDAPVPVPRDAPWFPRDVESWSVRWVVLHLIEEHARHAGHADIVRESIDGATMYELVAGREGWPETPWLRPWRAGART